MRTDQWGGQPLENRTRFPLSVFRAVRAAWADKPFFVRFSATDWAPGPEKGDDGLWRQWGIEQTTLLVGELTKIGVDLIDVSSGGTSVDQQLHKPLHPGYQVHCAFGSSSVSGLMHRRTGTFRRRDQGRAPEHNHRRCWRNPDAQTGGANPTGEEGGRHLTRT
jgi:2,4-dienoyl-CoA reductase-like NADH-dependent reductase (Old Yellow Enzyme family)